MPTSSATFRLRLEVVVVSMTTAVPKPVAPAARLVPVPPLQQLVTSTVIRFLLASVDIAWYGSCKVIVTA